MTTFAANKIEITSVKTNSTGINKIWVAGNVKLVLSQNDKEGVFVNENFDANNTSVLRSGQTLYINSTESHQVTINISVKDLQRIEAAGSSVVVTKGNFDVKYLQLFLSQSATAKIKSKVGSLYTVISEDAVLKMSGSSDEHTLIASNMENVKFDNFASLKTENLSEGVIMSAEKTAAIK
ncbi:GIN domain-containing protein [Pedobacter steynii]